MAFSGFLTNAGVPTHKMLSAAGLPALCEDKDSFVPVTRVWSFIGAAAKSTDPELGWCVGTYVGDQNLNATLREKLETAPSLYSAVRRLIDEVRSEASHLQIGLREGEDDVLLYTCYPGMEHLPGYHQSQAYQLGVFFSLIRRFLGRHWSPQCIGVQAEHFPHGFEERFPVSKISLNQPFGYMSLSRACLSEAAAIYEPDSTAQATRLADYNFDFAGTLRELLKTYIHDGYLPAAGAAELMDVSERTLARRLSQSGVTYGELVDEVRFTAAKKLLRQPGASIGDVAMQIGFNDQRNFSRMFRRVGGMSPRDFRKMQ